MHVPSAAGSGARACLSAAAAANPSRSRTLPATSGGQSGWPAALVNACTHQLCTAWVLLLLLLPPLLVPVALLLLGTSPNPAVHTPSSFSSHFSCLVVLPGGRYSVTSLGLRGAAGAGTGVAGIAGVAGAGPWPVATTRLPPDAAKVTALLAISAVAFASGGEGGSAAGGMGLPAAAGVELDVASCSSLLLLPVAGPAPGSSDDAREARPAAADLTPDMKCPMLDWGVVGAARLPAPLVGAAVAVVVVDGAPRPNLAI